MANIEALNYDDLFEPIFKALKKLGGSASNEELLDEVSSSLELSDEDIAYIKPNQSYPKFVTYFGFGKSYLKRAGLIDNTTRGVWSFTKEGDSLQNIDKVKIKRDAKNESLRLSAEKKLTKTEKRNKIPFPEIDYNENLIEDIENSLDENWQDELLTIIKKMRPSSFEKLCKHFLRECGFVKVEVTGGSGDGGIDGHGVLKIGSLLSFHVFFQAKRYKDSVASNVIRDFRGAMEGRADIGLIITTGTFTRDAIKEAQRDGAKSIDLIDGSELIEKLKELSLGVIVKHKTIEEVLIDKEWFDSI